MKYPSKEYMNKRDLAGEKVDDEYKTFVCRMLDLKKGFKKGGIEGDVSPREIDDFLLWSFENRVLNNQ